MQTIKSPQGLARPRRKMGIHRRVLQQTGPQAPGLQMQHLNNRRCGWACGGGAFQREGHAIGPGHSCSQCTGPDLAREPLTPMSFAACLLRRPGCGEKEVLLHSDLNILVKSACRATLAVPNGSAGNHEHEAVSACRQCGAMTFPVTQTAELGLWLDAGAPGALSVSLEGVPCSLRAVRASSFDPEALRSLHAVQATLPASPYLSSLSLLGYWGLCSCSKAEEQRGGLSRQATAHDPDQHQSEDEGEDSQPGIGKQASVIMATLGEWEGPVTDGKGYPSRQGGQQQRGQGQLVGKEAACLPGPLDVAGVVGAAISGLPRAPELGAPLAKGPTASTRACPAATDAAEAAGVAAALPWQQVAAAAAQRWVAGVLASEWLLVAHSCDGTPMASLLEEKGWPSHLEAWSQASSRPPASCVLKVCGSVFWGLGSSKGEVKRLGGQKGKRKKGCRDFAVA